MCTVKDQYIELVGCHYIKKLVGRHYIKIQYIEVEWCSLHTRSVVLSLYLVTVDQYIELVGHHYIKKLVGPHYIEIQYCTLKS